jgi:predicted Zn-dependent protease
LRTHSDAFGYTRILKGGIDAMIDPIVASYDVAAIQVLFDETPGAFCSTLHNHTGELRFRQGSFVAANSPELVQEIQKSYQEWCSAMTDPISSAFQSDVPFHKAFQLGSARTPLSFLRTETGFQSGLFAQALERAAATFLRTFPNAYIEDLCLLSEEVESVSVSVHQGHLVKPPVFDTDFAVQIRATVNGGFCSFSTHGNSENLVQAIVATLTKALEKGTIGKRVLSSRDQVIGVLGHIAFDTEFDQRSFQEQLDSLSALITKSAKSEPLTLVNKCATESEVPSISCSLTHQISRKSQIFLDGSQHAYAMYTSVVSGSVTVTTKIDHLVDGSAEKRSSHFRSQSNTPLSIEVFSETIEAEMAHAIKMAEELLAAPTVPQDIDYSHLAIDADLLGLILHEAVGHAAEGDLISLGSSGFGSQDFLKSDRKVTADFLDVCVDGTLHNCGQLPIDSEGVLPVRKALVRKGLLVDALHTRQTAKELKGTPDGCSRQESLHMPALNRMTSIWLVSEHSLPMPLVNDRNWHRLDPNIVRQTLENSGDLLSESSGQIANTVLFLSGWKGGTASCSNLEFRADVAYIYLLKAGQQPVLLREANFTGIATACFQNVVKTFGPHLCQTIGTCGKDSQGVQTSDGGPALVLMKKNLDVHLIGVGEADEES